MKKTHMYLLLFILCSGYISLSAQDKIINIETNYGPINDNKKELAKLRKEVEESNTSQEKTRLLVEKIEQEMTATNSMHRLDITTRDSVNKVLSIERDSLRNELRIQNDFLTAKDKQIVNLIKVIQSQEKNKFAPVSIKQFESSRVFESVRGGVYVIGQAGGLAGSIIYGSKWNAKKNDYANLKNKYSKEPYIAEKEKIKIQLDDTASKIGKYRRRFWISLGIMAGAYGFNVLDNYFWTRPNKNIGINVSCNEICLTYNF